MATPAGPDAAASFSARRRAPDFRFRLPGGHAHDRSNLESLGGWLSARLTLCADWVSPADRWAPTSRTSWPTEGSPSGSWAGAWAPSGPVTMETAVVSCDLPCYMTVEEMKSLIRLPDIIACAKQNITVVEVSARTGTGLTGVLRWLQDTHRTSR
ncbi:ADP-ribosylation factor-like protein 16 isoform X2 [Phyllostomus discolor]|uniref:ADP-ribosylation factor-like protein 16 isoform X2 n=1 Tax=Phyllostomus discolor TaxID=89673 RepID=A0A7E6EGK4_9CHIR|nr:ADP-ribosylation factor-like protein 16 isoform X2 [Phyllostomus discolor]